MHPLTQADLPSAPICQVFRDHENHLSIDKKRRFCLSARDYFLSICSRPFSQFRAQSKEYGATSSRGHSTAAEGFQFMHLLQTMRDSCTLMYAVGFPAAARHCDTGTHLSFL
jgi:hypothetical protein